MIKFSIAIPAYKSIYLRECIQSVLDQSISDFELIILDDNSPESLNEIVLTFSDERIRYYKNSFNVGAINVVDNWNKCLELAKGEYFLCIGDDDLLPQDSLKIYSELINKYPSVHIFHGLTEIVDEYSNFKRLQELRPEFESVFSIIWHRWNGRVQFVGDFLFKRAELLKVGGFYKLPLAWGSDDITSFRIAVDGGIVNSSKIAFRYRESSLTITNGDNSKFKIDAILQEEQWMSGFIEKLQPSSDIDLKFLKMIKEQSRVHYIKKKLQNIKLDFIRELSISNILFWCRNSKRFNINSVLLIKAIIDAILFKMKDKVI